MKLYFILSSFIFGLSSIGLLFISRGVLNTNFESIFILSQGVVILLSSTLLTLNFRGTSRLFSTIILTITSLDLVLILLAIVIKDLNPSILTVVILLFSNIYTGLKQR